MNNFNESRISSFFKQIWYKYKLYIIISLCLIIGLIIVLSVINKGQSIDTSNLTYKSVETIMKNNAEEYVKNNKITKNTYLSLNVLNLKIDNDLKCETISGVLKEQNNYYPYLLCDKYQSDSIENIINKNASNKSYGNLKGDNPYILTSGEYVEPGYDIDSKYTVNVKGSDIENGVNIISYYILENNNYVAELKRIVIAENILGEAPTIELVGNRTLIIPQNIEFKDPGYLAFDKIDGNITNKVKVTDDVDTKTPGTYKITYSVTNSKNITTTLIRTIVINKFESSLTINHTVELGEQRANILLNIIGNDYLKTVLPNNTESSTNKPTYTVYKNGVYEFMVYDKIGNVEVYDLKITDLDTSYPVVTCSLEVDKSFSTIVVEATDKEGIATYSYKYDSRTSGKLASNKYEVNGQLKQASVSVSDVSGNVTNAKCNFVDLTQEYTAGLFLKHHTNNLEYVLYVPEATKVNRKNTLVVFLHGAAQGYVGLDKMKQADLIKDIVAGKSYNTIIVAPRSNKPWIENSQKLIELISSITQQYNIDTNKIALTGFSFGGAGTWQIAMKYPNVFSCIVPIACGIECSAYKLDEKALIDSLKNMPIRAYVGSRDGNVERMKKIRDALINVNPNYSLTIVPNSPHNITNYVYNQTDTFNWMTSQSLANRK